MLIDARSGRIIDSQPLGGNGPAYNLRFVANGRRLLAQVDDQHWVWTPLSHKPARLLWSDPNSDRYSSLTQTDGRSAINSAPGADTLTRVNLADGMRKPDLRFDKVVAWGFVPGRPQFWAASADNGLRFWDTRNWAPMQTVVLFGRHHSLSYMPDGRYDTDLSPDTSAFRWLVNDEPERSLGPQTFMRTYFTPRLLERLDQCITVSGGCATAFAKQRAPVELDRALPVVTIDAVHRGSKPDTAEIDVTVANGVDKQAPDPARPSGMYDLRLFRNGSLVAEYPAHRTETVDEAIADWQTANTLPAGPDGKAHHHFVVALPTGPGHAKVRFSAYAFNSDRIKSDTARAAIDAPHTAPRPRRTFVLAIGINAYTEPRLRLHYASDDAMLIAQRLKHLPGQRVHTLTLTDGQATKAQILAALDLLAGGNRAADLAVLGGRTGGFVATTPDDDVIVTFSGHGWADAHGNFYLLPTDSDWHDTAEFPVRTTLLSSAELADALKPVDAGDMALVIDACHSAASVDTEWFKPGPMGDPGLGQLAFDKAIRILAAAGRDAVAREDQALHHGLLTAALAGDGINATGFGLADLNHDHKIMLDEWLRYAVTRLPELSEAEARKPGSSHRIGPFTVLDDSQARPPPLQMPALFDFTRHASTEILREEPRR